MLGRFFFRQSKHLTEGCFKCRPQPLSYMFFLIHNHLVISRCMTYALEKERYGAKSFMRSRNRSDPQEIPPPSMETGSLLLYSQEAASRNILLNIFRWGVASPSSVPKLENHPYLADCLFNTLAATSKKWSVSMRINWSSYQPTLQHCKTAVLIRLPTKPHQTHENYLKHGCTENWRKKKRRRWQFH